MTTKTEIIKKLRELENSNQDLRTISHQMMPRALKELGIIPALKDLLEGFEKGKDYNINIINDNNRGNRLIQPL